MRRQAAPSAPLASDAASVKAAAPGPVSWALNSRLQPRLAGWPISRSPLARSPGAVGASVRLAGGGSIEVAALPSRWLPRYWASAARSVALNRLRKPAIELGAFVNACWLPGAQWAPQGRISVRLVALSAELIGDTGLGTGPWHPAAEQEST